MSENVRIVDDLMRSFETLDIERILYFLNDDAVWSPIPMGLVAEGVDAIREAMGAIEVTPEKMEFVVHNTAENPETNVVMNERTERVKTDKGWSETRVMSVFRIENGKVQEWRDYFDMAEMQKALE